MRSDKRGGKRRAEESENNAAADGSRRGAGTFAWDNSPKSSPHLVLAPLYVPQRQMISAFKERMCTMMFKATLPLPTPSLSK